MGVYDVHVVLCYSKLGINKNNELRIVEFSLIIVLILVQFHRTCGLLF